MDTLQDPLHQTFPTEIDFAMSDEFNSNNGGNQRTIVPKLPTAVNFVAVRESLLSEAPFVTSKNKNFWRRCVNSRYFQNILSAAFHFISDIIIDSNCIDMKKLNSINKQSYLASYMSNNLAEMFFSMKIHDRDYFLSRIPEVLGFMLVNALLTSSPKYHRLFNSLRFREILLDWCSEVMVGLRFSNLHAGREWYFVDTTETQITLLNEPNKQQQQQQSSHTKSKFSSKHAIKSGITNEKVCLELSPLIDMYVSSIKRVENPMKTTLSQLPDRPLTTMSSFTPKYSRTRPIKIDNGLVREARKTSILRREEIMEEFTEKCKTTEEELQTMRHQLRDDIIKISTDFKDSVELKKKDARLKKEEWRASMKTLVATGNLPPLSPTPP